MQTSTSGGPGAANAPGVRAAEDRRRMTDIVREDPRNGYTRREAGGRRLSTRLPAPRRGSVVARRPSPARVTSALAPDRRRRPRVRLLRVHRQVAEPPGPPEGGLHHPPSPNGTEERTGMRCSQRRTTSRYAEPSEPAARGLPDHLAGLAAELAPQTTAGCPKASFHITPYLGALQLGGPSPRGRADHRAVPHAGDQRAGGRPGRPEPAPASATSTPSSTPALGDRRGRGRPC